MKKKSGELQNYSLPCDDKDFRCPLAGRSTSCSISSLRENARDRPKLRTDVIKPIAKLMYDDGDSGSYIYFEGSGDTYNIVHREIYDFIDSIVNKIAVAACAKKRADAIEVLNRLQKSDTTD